MIAFDVHLQHPASQKEQQQEHQLSEGVQPLMWTNFHLQEFSEQWYHLGRSQRPTQIHLQRRQEFGHHQSSTLRPQNHQQKH